MGMSASQARLLSITARMNDIEFKSQQVSNIKIRLADDSEKVANAYTAALNKQKFSFNTYDKNGNAQKIDLTAAFLSGKDSQYKLVRRDGKMLVSNDVKQNYVNRMSSWNNYVDNKFADSTRAKYPEWCAQMTSDHNARYNECEAEFILQSKFGVGGFEATYEACGINETETSWHNGFNGLLDAGLISQAEINFYKDSFAQLFNATSTSGDHVNTDAIFSIDNASANDPNWLYEALESGEFYLVDNTGKEISPSSTVQIVQESDTTELAKAEAEYNAATAKINKKEKQLDNEMKVLDTEHQGI